MRLVAQLACNVHTITDNTLDDTGISVGAPTHWPMCDDGQAHWRSSQGWGSGSRQSAASGRLPICARSSAAC